MTLSLRQFSPHEELDYLQLKEALKQYAYPRAKMTALLKNKTLIRVKKGLYVFGDDWAKKPVVKESLANLIYGPSALSLEYALSFYGFIPERVETLTSITPKRDKVFDTPLGRFTYRYLHREKYVIGISQVDVDPTHSILIACPEKALADLLMLSRSPILLKSAEEVEAFLFHDLRMDAEKILTLDREAIEVIARTYRHPSVDALAQYLKTHAPGVPS